MLVGVGLLGVTIAGTAILLAAGRAPSVLDRLRALPQDFAAAYREREAELRAALLPDDDAVAAARADVAARRASGRSLGAVPPPGLSPRRVPAQPQARLVAASHHVASLRGAASRRWSGASPPSGPW
ncbi:hypothetical protein [Georgenia sp. SUBG003]|uniref:hypothetical protein n=1 Tax=Georgenia sp. SUBG003 TaxID=1497974 RepID=UPI003AB8A4B0